MRLKWGVLADAANRSDTGKLNILGMFSSIGASRVPAQHPQMCLVLKLEATGGEKGTTKTLRIALLDADGVLVIPAPELKISIPKDAPGRNLEMDLIIEMAVMPLQKYGDFQFDILIDGNSVGQVSFDVVPAPPVAPEGSSEEGAA